jgi:hydrogenase maturation protease
MSVLIAGIGNIFLGDDAFGVEVAQRLAARADLPAQVEVVDFGIRGFDLAHALLQDRDATILIDATPRGGAPGTLYVIEPEEADFEAPDGTGAIETHAMDPLKVLRLAWSMGARPTRVLVVGCEPTPLAPDDYELGCMGLSEPVQNAVDEAITLVDEIVDQVITTGRPA